jgi:fatty-acyl-CoA synthase
MYQIELTQSLFPAQRDTPYRPTTIAAMIREQARERGETTALREVLADGTIGREWRYADLCRDCEKLGRALAARHERGARIAIFANNMPEWILLELAAGFAALTLVTVNPAFNARELRYILEQSRAEAVYFAPWVRGNPLAPIVDQACTDLPSVRYRIALTDHVALFDGEADGALRETVPEDVVQIQYTSGTTGFPKGALLHHNGLIQNGFDTNHRWGTGPGDPVLVIMPLFHTAGCALSILGGLSHGATLLLAQPQDNDMLVRLIERERPVLLLGVPTMIVGLIDAAERTGCDVTSLRSLMSGGAMVAPELVAKARRVFDAPIQIIYGQTETSPGITLSWSDDSKADLSGTIGQPLPHMHVAILDTLDGSICPIGVQGEICCRGYHVMTGYNDNPEATAATIDPDGWLHTGDLGTMDARGYVKITGRVKDMIIRGGENLFPAEIENVLLEHPHVVEAAVVGVPDERWGEIVVGFLRLAPGAALDRAALVAHCRERMAPQKTPAHWVVVQDWPLTGSGKIQKFKLAEQFVAEHLPV